MVRGVAWPFSLPRHLVLSALSAGTGIRRLPLGGAVFLSAAPLSRSRRLVTVLRRVVGMLVAILVLLAVVFAVFVLIALIAP